MKFANSLLFLTSSMFMVDSSALLSSSSTKIITGTPPTLYAEDNLTPAVFDDALYFKVPESSNDIITYYGNSPSLATKEFPTSLTFNDFDISHLSNGNWDNYYDADGDTKATRPVSVSSYQVQWRDRYGRTPITTAHLSSCDAPYTLTLTTNDTTVHSSYGTPSMQNLGTLNKVFTINVKESPEICFLQPTNMAWFGWDGSSLSPNWSESSSNGVPTIDAKQGGGATDDFVTGKGFVPNPQHNIGNSGTFPTTGFVGAEFIITLFKLSSGYTFSSTNPSIKLTQLSDHTAKVEMINKPAGTVDIQINAANGETLTYSFNIKTWADVKFVGVGSSFNSRTYQEAQDDCNGLSNILKRSEITNTPRSISWLSANNSLFTRAVGTISGEWGALSNNTANIGAYPNSGWILGYYWTSETHPATASPYLVGVKYGSVQRLELLAADENNHYVVCRG